MRFSLMLIAIGMAGLNETLSGVPLPDSVAMLILVWAMACFVMDIADFITNIAKS